MVGKVIMGRKGRRGKSKAASVSGGHPEENTGSHPVKELDPAAAAPATGSLPEKDLDTAAAPATGSRRGSPDRYVFPPDWWATHDLYEFPDDYFEFVARQIKSDPRYGFGRSTQSQVKRNTDQPRDADHIIAFAREIERQNELIVFKDYLKQRVDIIQPDSNNFDILEVLVHKERVHKHYKNLEFQDIMNAINVCIVDLRIERGRKEDIELSLMCAAFLKNNDGKSFNPFRDLVKAVRQKDYIMDEDPLKELNIIENHHPTIYHNYFRERMVMKNLENEVQVSGVPLDYDEEQVKAAFSVCGEIVDVKVERGGPWSNIAYVTFKESEGAKIAPFLMDRARFSVLPIREIRKLATDSELREALKRYNDFRLSKARSY